MPSASEQAPRLELAPQAPYGGPRATVRLRVLYAQLRRPGMGRSMAQTAGFNVASQGASAVGALLFARAAGPAIRGEYAAVTAWFGIALMLGEMGQPVALCYYVAQDPRRARDYVATSRSMMLVTGVVASAAGLLLAPELARGNAALAGVYRLAFAGLIVALVGDSYTFALQARDLQLWNRVRISQPVLSMIAIIVLWRLRLLTLDTVIWVLIGTMFIELVWSYWGCRRTELAPGRIQTQLIRPLASYGSAQIASVAPASVNIYLDQLVLSVTVPAADLGRYAIAAALTLLPISLVSAIGYVAFPHLAAQRVVSAGTFALQRLAVLASAGIAAAILLPLAAVAPWLIPLALGPGYRGAVPLLWILAPGGIFLACGQVVSDLLRGRKRPMVVAKAEGMAAVVTIALLAALVPVMGVTGAAIASTVPYGISLALMLRCLRRLPTEGDEDQPVHYLPKHRRKRHEC